MTCPSCGHANPEQQKFCGECGARLGQGLARAAGAAGRPSDAAIAARDSTSALRGERKQVTVMFCDIVDSTSLAARMGADRMHSVLNEFWAAAVFEVQRYEGTANQFLGDGFMALFGAPVAHEDHARRAVLAAIAIQDSMAARTWNTLPAGVELKIRIGLHTGAVVFGKIGDDQRMDFTAIGDTANVASRLQGQAMPGTVACSDAVVAMVREYFECRPLGMRMLKGKADPFPVFQVLRARKAGSVANSARMAAGAEPLLGRNAELAAIKTAVDDLLRGRGGIVTVMGEAGLGKSRLLAQARAEAAGKPLRWVEGSCLSFGKTLSYWPFREVLRGCFSVADEHDEAEALRVVQGGLLPLFGEQAVELLPYLAALMGLPLSGPDAAGIESRIESLDSLSMGHQIFRASLRLFERLAQDRPLLIVLEDWHWADVSSTALLEHLLGLAGTIPLLFVIVSRPGEHDAVVSLKRALDATAESRRLHRAIELRPLSASAARALVDRVLGGGALPGNLNEQLLHRAGGNPFYLGELVRTLIATHVIERSPASGAWLQTGRSATIMLPDTIEGVIMARVDRLGGNAKQLLKTAAVLGHSFMVRVLQGVVAGDTRLDTDLATLKFAELLQDKQQLPEPELMFKHPLIQQAAYGSLLDDGRRRLHGRVAACIESLFTGRLEEFHPVLAYHYAQAEEWDKAQEYLLKAGEQAGRIAADAEALELFETALKASDASSRSLDPVRRAQLDGGMAEALFRQGRNDAAVEHALTGLSGLGISYPTSRSGIFTGIVRKLLRVATHGVTAPFGRMSGQREAPLADDSYLAAAHLFEVIGNIDYYLNPSRFVLGILTMHGHAQARPLSRGLVLSTSAMALICDSVGLYRIARAMHVRARQLAADLGDGLALGYCEHFQGLHEYSTGNWSAALTTLESAADRLEAAGHLRLWASATGARYFVLRSMGDPRWLDLVARQHEVATRIGDRHALAWAINATGVGHMYRGEFEPAITCFEKACAAYEAIPDYRFLAGALARRAHCLALRGEVAVALPLLERSRALVVNHPVSGMSATAPVICAAEAWLCCVEVSQDASEKKRLLVLAGQACARATRHGRRVRDESAAEALRLHGIHAFLSGDAGRAERYWKRGLALARNMRAMRVLALIHHELGTRFGDRPHAEAASALLVTTGSRVLTAVQR